jgi:hypothetical protein
MNTRELILTLLAALVFTTAHAAETDKANLSPPPTSNDSAAKPAKHFLR